MSAKNFNGVDSYAAIGAVRGKLSNIRRRLRKTDDALPTDLNARLAEIDRALYHCKEVAALLTTARNMRGRD